MSRASCRSCASWHAPGAQSQAGAAARCGGSSSSAAPPPHPTPHSQAQRHLAQHTLSWWETTSPDSRSASAGTSTVCRGRALRGRVAGPRPAERGVALVGVAAVGVAAAVGVTGLLSMASARLSAPLVPPGAVVMGMGMGRLSSISQTSLEMSRLRSGWEAQIKGRGATAMCRVMTPRASQRLAVRLDPADVRCCSSHRPRPRQPARGCFDAAAHLFTSAEVSKMQTPPRTCLRAGAGCEREVGSRVQKAWSSAPVDRVSCLVHYSPNHGGSLGAA